MDDTAFLTQQRLETKRFFDAFYRQTIFFTGVKPTPKAIAFTTAYSIAAVWADKEFGDDARTPNWYSAWDTAMKMEMWSYRDDTAEFEYEIKAFVKANR